MKCKACKLLDIVMPEIKSDYQYWLMTELFVYLHDNKSYCDIESKEIVKLTNKQFDNLEKEMNEKNTPL